MIIKRRTQTAIICLVINLRSRGPGKVAVVRGVSLSLIGVHFRERLAVIELDVGIIGLLHTGGILATDGTKDCVGKSNRFSLLGLILSSRVDTRVKEDEGILVLDKCGEFSLLNKRLQLGNTITIDLLCLGHSGS